jgi:hypothetical protein
VWAVQNWSNGRCRLFKIGILFLDSISLVYIFVCYRHRLIDQRLIIYFIFVKY